MKPILYTVTNLIEYYLIILGIVVTAITGTMYLFNPALDVDSNILTSTILVIIFDAFVARVKQEYNAAKSHLEKS